MKILIMISNPPFDGIYGGAENFTKEVSIRLSEKGHKVHLLCEKQLSSLPNKETIESITVHRYCFPKIPKLTWLYTNPKNMFKAGKEIIKENSFDIILAIELYQTGWVGTKLGSIYNIPSIISLRNVHNTYLNTLLGIPLPIRSLIENRIKWSLNNANKIHAISESVKKDYIENFGLDSSKIRVIGNGVDVNKFKPSGYSEDNKYKPYTEERYPTIVYPARFNQRQKRHDIIIEMVKILREEYEHNPFAFLVGNGNPSYVTKNVKSKGIEDSFFIGKVPHKDMPQLYNAVDLCVFPTNYEGRSLALMECISSGLPVVGTDIPMIREIVDEDTGSLVKNKASLFAEEVNKLCKDKNILKEKTKNARDRAMKYSWDKIVDKVDRLLLEVTQNV